MAGRARGTWRRRRRATRGGRVGCVARGRADTRPRTSAPRSKALWSVRPPETASAPAARSGPPAIRTPSGSTRGWRIQSARIARLPARRPRRGGAPERDPGSVGPRRWPGSWDGSPGTLPGRTPEGRGPPGAPGRGGSIPGTRPGRACSCRTGVVRRPGRPGSPGAWPSDGVWTLWGDISRPCIFELMLQICKVKIIAANGFVGSRPPW